MNYTICSSCGQKALSVATRCPRCGLAFEEQFLSRARSRPKSSRWMPLVVLILGVVGALVGANALMRRLSMDPQGMVPPPVPAAPAVAAVRRPAADTQPTPPRDAPAERVESLVPVARAPVVVDTPAPAPRVVKPAAPVPAAPLPAAAPVPAPVAAGPLPTQRRYASLWTNVRAARSNTAPVLRILRPGEVVQVDSLARGWYRVMSDGLPVGYTDRRLLADAPSPDSP